MFQNNVHHMKIEAAESIPSAKQIEIHPWHVVTKPLAEYMDKNEILPTLFHIGAIPNWREVHDGMENQKI